MRLFLFSLQPDYGQHRKYISTYRIDMLHILPVCDPSEVNIPFVCSNPFSMANCVLDYDGTHFIHRTFSDEGGK